MIYVKLKEFRAKHGKMKQSELAELFGIGQTDVSRMEQGFKLLSDEQYQILVNNFGIDDVMQYVTEPPHLNAMSGKERQRIRKAMGLPEQASSQDLIALARVISDQQKTIIKLEEEIETLKAKLSQ